MATVCARLKTTAFQSRTTHSQTVSNNKEMKEYFELRDNQYNWHPVKFIEKDDNFEKFLLLSDNKEIELKTGSFTKREMSVHPIHLERLNFSDANNNYNEVNNVKIIPVYNISGLDLQNLRLEFFGYTVFNNTQTSKMENKFKTVFEKYNNQEITKEEVEKEFESFYTISDLFEVLKKNSIDFNESKIIVGK